MKLRMKKYPEWDNQGSWRLHLDQCEKVRRHNLEVIDNRERLAMGAIVLVLVLCFVRIFL